MTDGDYAQSISILMKWLKWSKSYCLLEVNGMPAPMRHELILLKDATDDFLNYDGGPSTPRIILKKG